MSIDAAGFAWIVLEASLRALAAALAVGLLLGALRVRAAAVRHRAWSAVLVAMLLMPVLPSIVPALPVPVRFAGVRLDRGADVYSPPAAVRQSTEGRSDPGAIPTPPRGPAQTPSIRLPQFADAAPRASRAWFASLLLAVYAAGVLLGVARLGSGWMLASAMIRRAVGGGPIRVGGRSPVYESPEVAVPMTVGAIHPVIVLPLAWRTWDPETLAAVVAHETAHVDRRDAAISLAARLNRAIFWFHPIAWWLERTLAVTAEHACDDEAARAIGAPDRYARILVDMADVVRRHGGRLVWQGVGVDGAGLLDRRIDRLIRGAALARTSRLKTIAAGVGCVLAIGMAIACRQQVSAAPLREDPELARRLVDRAEQTKQFEAARDMTEEQASALEQRIAANPEDFDVRRQLVTYYRTSSKVAWTTKVPGLRVHALWLIEHHPEHDVQAPPLSPQYDPQGFAAAKRLWEAHLAKPDVSPFLVFRAASYFAPYDKPYAEGLIRRGMAMDPDSAALKARMPADVGAYEWPVQLSSLYGAALLGSESAWGTYNDLRTHVDQVHSPDAMQVRRTLETTTDARLLARVGGILTRPRSGATDPPAMTQALDETRALGVGYLERALQLNPSLESAKATLVRLALPERATDADRLAARAYHGLMTAEDITEYAKKDPAAAKQQRDESKARAEEVLRLAAAHAQDPAYSAAVMTAHQVLATVALRDGDRDAAVRHLTESVNVPASDEIRYAPPFAWNRAVNRLLKDGERTRVVAFLEAFARLTVVERNRLLKDAQTIREGRMTTSYQSTIAREGR